MATPAPVMDGVDLRIVPLSNLTPAPGNPRKQVGDVADLAASMASHGILEPLIVVEGDKDDHYLVVCGQRRLKAAKLAKVGEIPVIVRELDDKAMLEVMLIENLQREDLTPLEEAQTFHKLVNDLGYSQRHLGDVVGCSQAHISKRLSLLTLPKAIQTSVGKGELAVTDAVELARLEEGKASEVLKYANATNMPIRQVVDREIKEQERLAKIEKVTAEQKAKGLTVFGPEEIFSAGVRIGKTAWDRDFTDLKVTEHAKLPCHAVGVNSNGEIVPMCTKPSIHKKGHVDPGKSTREVNRDKKEKEQRAAEREQAKVRREHLISLVSTRISAPDRLEGIVLGFLAGANSDPSKMACALMGLEPEKKQYGTDYRGALEAEAKKGPEQLARVGLAIALGYLEDQFEGYGDVDRRKAYLSFLRKTGYRTSAVERARTEPDPR